MEMNLHQHPCDTHRSLIKYNVYKILVLTPFLSQLNLSFTLEPCFLNSHFNIVYEFMPMYPERSVMSDFGIDFYAFRRRFILEIIIIIVAILTTKKAKIITTTTFSFGVLWNCPNFHYFAVRPGPTANDMKYGRNKRRNKRTYWRAV